MKKLLDKTWAKVTAFCLLVVFTALTVAGGAGIALLVSENVYRDGGYSVYEYLYRADAYDAVHDVYGYLQNDAAFTADPSEELKTRFARDYRDWHYAIEVCAYAEDGESSSIILDNYRLAGPSPYTLSLDYVIGGTKVTISAAADPSRIGLDFEDTLLSRLVRLRHALIVFELLAAAAWLFCFSFTLSSAGHWRGYEGIHLTWFDKIPMDVWALLVYLAGNALEWQLVFVYDVPMTVAVILAAVILFYLILTAFAAQCKAGTVLKGTAIAFILRLLWKALRWLGCVIVRIPLVWKTALAVAAMLAFDLLCLANMHDGEFLPAMLIGNLLAGLFLIYLAIGLKKLQKGGRALAEGDFSAPVDTKWLICDLRRHADDLNSIQQGVKKAVEQQMRSERMKTELITNVSHDIKTPLTSIVNYVDLLKREKIDNPTAVRYIEVLDRQSARLRRLTDDLVEASKAASGSIPVTLSDTDVNVFLTQAVGEYRQRLTESGIEPVLVLDESDPHIKADGRLLWRVLDNLLSNVNKYAMPGTRVYVSSETSGERVSITVKNISRYPLNISADELTERFVRGDASRSTEGSGLGLSIASGLAKLQNAGFGLSVDGDLFKARLEFDRIQPV
ncbi:MAG: HAMP domain-containing histidine kinase [Clostridia bacterium]|nr:HAMP domain-containing histidine kinase [Clostridia bacterium]